MYKVILFVTLITIAGCATIAYNYHPTIQKFSQPAMSQQSKVYVGEYMLSQGNKSFYDAIYINQDVKVGMINHFTLKKGYYIKIGETKKEEVFQPSSHMGGEIIKGLTADPPEAIKVIKANNKVFVVSTLGTTSFAKKINFERTQQEIATPDSFQQTLIYNGKIGNKVNIGYREFSNNKARPAFSNDVEYDLSQSNIIGYKQARIKVFEATNEYIEYEVIQNF